MESYIAVAEMKNHFSEYISRSSYNHDRFIITKRSKPIAALVNIDDLKLIEQLEERKGLASIIGKWEEFDELGENIGDIIELRERGGSNREISF